MVDLDACAEKVDVHVVSTLRTMNPDSARAGLKIRKCTVCARCGASLVVAKRI